MKNKFLLLAALCCCALVAVGCSKGPKLLHITGSVKVADETVDTGSVTFKSADGANMTDADFERLVISTSSRVDQFIDKFGDLNGAEMQHLNDK